MSSICLYSPYIPKHRGGGEMYLLQVAHALQDTNKVYIAVSNLDKETETQKIISDYEQFFGLSLDKVKIISTPLGTSAHWLKKLMWTKQWDVLYYVTDGSIFPTLARTNILHIQVPLLLDKSSLIEKCKLSMWQVINTNSEFTKKIVSKAWPVHVDYVHSPYVSLPKEITQTDVDKKEKIIVHIGRFFRQLHSKRQDMLVDTFKQMIQKYPKELKGWKLVLIGGIEDQAYADEVHTQAAKLPVEFYHQTSRKEILELLQKASIYWHATGYEVDQNKHPEKVEHFGISTIEAMAAGCVPVVIHAGGQPEILGKELQGNLWRTQKECIQETLSFIEDSKQRRKTALIAQQRAKTFSEETFNKVVQLMIHQ